jgi:DNA repair photolyase
MIWEKTTIHLPDGSAQEAVAPLIISASRRTDIPANYSVWLKRQLQKGYVGWKNPYNQKVSYVSFEKARLFVFWSKNPAPLFPVLPLLDEHHWNYYFQFTLNDYEAEGLEPLIPPLARRVETFQKLSQLIGAEKVVWRFDPLFLTRDLSLEKLMYRVESLARELSGYTRKLVFSFADISLYRKVERNLRNARVDYREFTPETMQEAAQILEAIGTKYGLEIRSCCEAIDLSRCGIQPNKCIDDDLIRQLFRDDRELMNFVGGPETLFPGKEDNRYRKIKDPSQRPDCGCIASKDIGEYDTCPLGCLYCYANRVPGKTRPMRQYPLRNNE